MENEDRFGHYYARQRQKLGVMFKDHEFLYPNNEPWPESSFDYPYGQAPTVSNLPPEETKDWQAHVGNYYIENALGTTDDPSPFGVKSAEFARDKYASNGIQGYANISDKLFLELICEGLYSKYLGPLDPQDEKLFGVKSDAKYQYLKSDQSCMRVVKKPWDGEHVAPSIAVVRRKLPLTDVTKWDYELVAIALAEMDKTTKEYEYRSDLVFSAKEHKSSSAWWLAKYYVLQGAIHRINLVDHIKVHFPADSLNAITKSALPQWHLLQQFLLPHLRLTLPVNNVVLEGDRSIINRDTWYPWSPVTANGEEIRKLIPVSWGGYEYYFDEKNSSFPRFCFSMNPKVQLDANYPGQEVPTFIGLEASRYAKYLYDYWEPILEYSKAVIGQLPEPPSDSANSDLTWLEIQRWAHEISELLPGFPNEKEICNKEVLANACAMVIWNAAVVHSADHSLLHMMIDKYPVPFILRVKPPKTNAAVVEETLGDALGEKGMSYMVGAVGEVSHVVEHVLVNWLKEKLPKFAYKLVRPELDKIFGDLQKDGEKHIAGIKLSKGRIPLCWPTDFIYCKMADLLFYRPHNTTLLYDCDYEFLSKGDKKLRKQWIADGRPVVTKEQKTALASIRQRFQKQLEAVNANYYDAAGNAVAYPEKDPKFHPSDLPVPMDYYGLPKLIPGSRDTPKKTATRTICCLGASIQY